MHDIFDDGTLKAEYNNLKHELLVANKKIQNYENGALGIQSGNNETLYKYAQKLQ